MSWPFDWVHLDAVDPRAFTIRTALSLLGNADPWVELMPAPQVVPSSLVDEGHAMPNDRVEAMHEGKRRKRARGE